MPLQPRIETVHIKNFRSIPSQIVRVSSPTFLIGANGSGKSNFVDVFAFLADAMELPLQTVFDRRGGISAVRHRTPLETNNAIGIGIELSNLAAAEIDTAVKTARYAFEAREMGGLEIEVVREQCILDLMNGRTVWFEREGGRLRSNLDWFNEFKGRWLSSSSLAMSVFGSVSPFSALYGLLRRMKVYSIDPEVISGFQEADSGLTLRSDGGNAASVLSQVKRASQDDFHRIGELLAAVSPGIDEVRPSRHGKFVGFEFVQRWGEKNELTFDAFSMSKGTLRALGILLAVYQRTKPFLIVIEEPEASLHPGAVNTILDVLRHASQTMQVIITTQSPEVLDSEWLTDEDIRFVSWGEGKTTVSDLAESSRTAIRKHLMGIGEMLRSNVLEPASLFLTLREPSLFRELE
jgi:predicted ATPase